MVRASVRDYSFMALDINSIKKIHAIGIGGIGVSALAKYFVLRGTKVTGSDSFDSEIVREAARDGVKTCIGHQASNVPADADLVLYSDAIPENNPERMRAKELGLLELSYAGLLGELSKTKKTIGIAGTNGKSSTTAMVGLILERAGFDPTVIVGSKVPGWEHGNLRAGASDWLVVEADEYRAHLLELVPEHAIITNIEEDHLDYYRDLSHIKETFFQFAKKISAEGNLVINNDDPASVEVESLRLKEDGFDTARVTFGIDLPSDYMAKNLRALEGRQEFELLRTVYHEEILGNITLQIPGKFNVMNALSAASLATSLGIDFKTVQETLTDFHGIWRRFEKVGKLEVGSWKLGEAPVVISDYAHHPTSVAGTILASREFYPGRRLVVVFQPHQHNRTKKLFSDFVNSLAGADVLILPEIYDVPGREEVEDQNISSLDLVNEIKKRGLVPDCRHGGNLEETEKIVRSIAQAGDIILIMGAGDIDKVARILVKS